MNRDKESQRNDKAIKACRLCPRECGADRQAGKSGVCGVDAGIYIARAALHMWEEPCISGTQGSGTVFFSGCPLRCIYCQNAEIADAAIGKRITVERLAEIFQELAGKGAANINLVTPTHYTEEIIQAVRQARNRGLQVPIVYNCSGYEKVETLQKLEGIVDIYLTDFKYMNTELAAEYSHAPDYPAVAKAALQEMVRQQSIPVFDGQGMMKRGIIVRHLLLPGAVRQAKEILEYVYHTYGNQIYISIMNQYTPLTRVKGHPKLGRHVTGREYDRLVDYAIELGIEQAFIQEGGTSTESFIPAFDYEGVEKGRTGRDLSHG